MSVLARLMPLTKARSPAHFGGAAGGAIVEVEKK